MTRNFAITAMTLLLGVTTGTVARSQQASPSPRAPYLTVGLFIASIEEGARIFTPVRLLPFEHPESLGHEFPTVLQFHGGEDALLVILGRAAGLQLATTLQRYPQQPDDTWSYQPFLRPPVDRFGDAPVTRRSVEAASLPGLRAVAFLDRFPVAFLIDTRGMSLAARHMNRPTSSGLDITRAELLRALETAAGVGPDAGAWILVYQHP